MLDAPRTAPIALTILLILAGLAVRLLFPHLLIAQGLLGLATLWMVSRALQIHRLHLDLDHRTYRYYRGWQFASPERQGSFADIANIAVEAYQGADGLKISRLRSRMVLLEFADWQGDVDFALGFPMGPQVAQEKGANYAKRLGVSVVDRTDSGEKVQP